MTRDNEIAKAASVSMTEVLMSTPNYVFSPRATDLLECAYIKGAEWADSHPINPWHSVADGDFPKTRNDTRYLLDGVTCKNAYIVTDGKEWWVDYYVPMDNSWASQSTPTHWMEIPQLPK